MAASDRKVETRILAVTTTDQTVDFGAPQIQTFYFHADTDNVVQVDFDQPTDASSFILGVEPVEINVPANRLHVRTTTSTANLYVLAIR